MLSRQYHAAIALRWEKDGFYAADFWPLDPWCAREVQRPRETTESMKLLPLALGDTALDLWATSVEETLLLSMFHQSKDGC